jgi:hypothetical protein
VPHWLVVLSWAGVAFGVASALVVAVDLLVANRQAMWIMNVVWPVTALWAGPLGAAAYFRYGRAGSEASRQAAKGRGQTPPNRAQPFPVLVAKGTMHCGSGCTLGDMTAALLVLAAPFTVFGHRLFGAWVYEFVAAFVLGVAFQYFTIMPMRHVSAAEGLKDALKADTLSLAAWQIGMYGWMAVTTFAIFDRDLGPSSVVFWFMMQIGMVAGFFTSYPINWWLLRKGIKEAM